MRDSFVFYRSFSDSLRQLDDKDFKEAVIAIWDYALDDTEPALEGQGKIVFPLIKPQIDANKRRYENGAKGGRPRTKTEPKNNISKTKHKPNKNQTITKLEPNVNVNENVNDNANVNVNENVNDITPHTPRRETQEQIFDRLTKDKYVIPALGEKIREWLKYKSERREPYKETGMKCLLTKIENAVHNYGVDVVMEAIDNSMASGWKGLFFDKLKNQGKPTTYVEAINNRYDVLTEWYEANKEYEERKRYDTG